MVQPLALLTSRSLRKAFLPFLFYHSLANLRLDKLNNYNIKMGTNLLTVDQNRCSVKPAAPTKNRHAALSNPIFVFNDLPKLNHSYANMQSPKLAIEKHAEKLRSEACFVISRIAQFCQENPRQIVYQPLKISHDGEVILPENPLDVLQSLDLAKKKESRVADSIVTNPAVHHLGSVRNWIIKYHCFTPVNAY